MIRTIAFRWMVALMALGVTGAASAEFGQGLVFSAERMFGLAIGERAIEDSRDNRLDEDNYTLFGLGWGQDVVSPVLTPRFAIDYFVMDNLSVGGTFGFNVINVEDDDGRERDGHGIILHVRVGYAFMFADWAGIWPRGGITFYTQDDIPIDQDSFGLTLEAPFILSPGDHFAFTVGPTFDIGVAGDYNDDFDRDRDLEEWWFGINFGLMGWIDI